MKDVHGDSIEARVGGLEVKVDKLDRRMTESFRHVDERFEQVDKRFDGLEADLKELCRETKKGFERMEDKLTGIHRSFFVVIGTLTAGYITGLAALIGLIATQM